MSNYRIKTEKEMLSDFGENWRHVLCWNSCGKMDYLLGKPFNGKYTKTENIPIDIWLIDHRSLTLLTPTYNPKEKIVRFL